jgi:hypothetical protein
MNGSWVATVKSLVSEVITQQAGKKIRSGLFTAFRNVWLQDSTAVRLPDTLFEKFRGKIMDGKKKSVAKLNIIVEVCSGLCPVMEWNSFSCTEQSLSTSILQIARPGDLVIRDLGYFVFKVFGEMNAAGIYFLSRWKYGVKIYDTKTGEEIDLLKQMKGRSWIDMKVVCGKKERLPVRLVAVRLPIAVANERKRKAKEVKHIAMKHNRQYYLFLDYVIFITNVEDKVWSYQQVADAYRVRWNVELLFKSWKSGLHIEKLIPSDVKHTQRVEGVLYLMLLYISWFQQLVYNPLRWHLHNNGKQLSLLKTVKWILPNTAFWITGMITSKLKNEIYHFCCYDTRCRTNAVQRFEQSFTNLT